MHFVKNDVQRLNSVEVVIIAYGRSHEFYASHENFCDNFKKIKTQKQFFVYFFCNYDEGRTFWLVEQQPGMLLFFFQFT